MVEYEYWVLTQNSGHPAQNGDDKMAIKKFDKADLNKDGRRPLHISFRFAACPKGFKK